MVTNNRQNWTLLKESGRIQVYKGSDQQGRPAVFKIYQLSTWLARRAFRRKQKNLLRFYGQSASLAVPELLSAGLSGDRREGIFCYAWLPGKDLRQFDWSGLAEPVAFSLMRQSGELLKRLHQLDWVHGDFKFGNLLFDQPRDSLYLLDVEAVRRSRSTARRARDVGRFVLNGLEMSLPASWLELFWSAYQDGSDPVERVHMKAHVRHWLHKLERRHRRKYGRSVSLDELAFL